MEESCVFCAIADGRIETQHLDEDERTVTFLDTSPWTRGHALVIPRSHARDLLAIDPDDLAAVALAGRRHALRARERLEADGINLLNSNGVAAWQSVFHFHLHVIPRYEGDGLPSPARPAPADPAELATLAELLRA